MAKNAADQGAQIICLQELYCSQYFPQHVDVDHYGLARPLDDHSVTIMQKLAAEKKCVMIVPVYEYAMDGVYFNSVKVFDADGTSLGKYRKIHIPDGPQYYEKFYFTPGDLGYPVFQTRYGTLGVGICWDEWFPEVARILSLKDAQILIYPSAIGTEPDHPEYSSQNAWETVIKSHAVANNNFVAAINRVGKEGDMTFYGGSFVSDPNGDVLIRGGTEDEILTVDIDLSQIKKFRDMLQFHRDRRPDTYTEILRQVISE